MPVMWPSYVSYQWRTGLQEAEVQTEHVTCFGPVHVSSLYRIALTTCAELQEFILLQELPRSTVET